MSLSDVTVADVKREIQEAREERDRQYTDSPLIDADAQEVRRLDCRASGPSRQVLTAYGVESLREECVATDGTAKEWHSIRKEFDDYYMSQQSAADTWESQKGLRPTSHRFAPSTAREVQGKIYGGLREYYTDELPQQTALLTLEGWPFDDEGQPAPPVEYLHGLVEGRQAVIRELRRRLDSNGDVHQWGYAWILEPHGQREETKRKGYPHCHIGVPIIGDVRRSDLSDIVVGEGSTYVESNPFARPKDHGAKALKLKHADDVETVESLAGELTNALVGYEFGGQIHQSPTHIRRFAALLWATGKHVHGFGSTFREWVELSQRDWEPDGECQQTEKKYQYDGGTPDTVEPDPVDVAYSFPEGFDPE